MTTANRSIPNTKDRALSWLRALAVRIGGQPSPDPQPALSPLETQLDALPTAEAEELLKTFAAAHAGRLAGLTPCSQASVDGLHAQLRRARERLQSRRDAAAQRPATF